MVHVRNVPFADDLVLLDPKAVLYMVHHVFLPPKLPQKDDFDAGFDDALLDMLSSSLQAFEHHVDDKAVRSTRDMISNLRTMRDGSGAMDETKIKEALRGLHEKGN
jgi:hypothetical protein